MTLPTDPKERKEYPIATGFLAYFPDAAAEVAHLSLVANRQHNGDEPLHWAKEKSTDEPDALLRHLIPALADPYATDTDGILHIVKVAWRGMAWAQRVLESKNTRRDLLVQMMRDAEAAGLYDKPEVVAADLEDLDWGDDLEIVDQHPEQGLDSMVAYWTPADDQPPLPTLEEEEIALEREAWDRDMDLPVDVTTYYPLHQRGAWTCGNGNCPCMNREIKLKPWDYSIINDGHQEHSPADHGSDRWSMNACDKPKCVARRKRELGIGAD